MKFPLLLLSCIFCLPGLVAAASPGGEERPNIVFLLSDDQCTYSMGCYGNGEVKTPHLDALAKDGMAFDCHYVSTAICMGSRANIMTGKFEFRHGCNFEHGALHGSHWANSYPILLKKGGYLTAMAGKIGFVVTKRPGKKGLLPEKDFDKWGAGPGQTHYQTARNKSMAAYAGEYPHSSRSYGAFGADFISEAVKAGKPFCLSISFKAPHKPATPDPLDEAIYADKTFTRPGNFGREYGLHFARQSRRGRQYERFYGWNYADNYDEVMATYHQQVYAVDVATGMIRAALKRHGVAGNTVVIFTSDNGFLCGSHGYGSKVLPYEESSRVPLIIHDPRHANSGKELRCDALTGNVDLMPTILELAGVEVPAGIDGRSVLPLYGNPQGSIRTALPLINVWGPSEVHSLAVVTRETKYIYWPWSGEGFEPVEELYDTERDPLELENLVRRPEKHGDLLQRMRRSYDGFVQQWRQGAVPYHNYKPFAVFFDRGITWPDKVSALRN
ncbi:MAG: sulfatase [Roseibacillus sp.]|nr:sulfatase [Roseibacillus sp.]